MMLKRFAAGCVTAVIALLVFEQCVRASGWVTGRGRFEKIAGRPAIGYVQLYEWDLFLSPADNSMVGPCRRLGAPPGQTPTYDGYYRIDNLPAGVYSIYVNQPDFFASPKMAPNVQIVDGQETPLNIDLDVDYSTYFKNTAQQQWTDWRWTWYQTFLATGTSVRGVSWVMAGWDEYNGDWAEVSILEDNGNADVYNWKVLGSKTDNSIASDSDEWVRWFSGQIPITPGKKYAVKIWVNGGCAIYKRDKDGSSYPQGRAYDEAGNPKDYDLNVTVFVDRNNQMVTHTRLSYGPGTFISSLNDTQWGQTFAARGNGLAAVDLFAASSDDNFDLTWRIRQGGPAGPQIGPTKTTQGAYFASTTDLVGVSYNPNEVSLIHGQTYYIEVTDTMGFTPYVQEGWNSYSDGAAFRRGTATGYDLAMTIVEYADTQRAEPADLNGNGSVDFLDYALLANQWLQPPATPSADIAPPPNGDQLVDFLDLAVFVEHWLKLPLPDPASNPNPPDGATDVGKTPLLSWTPGAGATSHDVYFGTESPGDFQRNQTEATFSPGTLLTNKIYYWHIDEVNSNGKTTGTVWSFKTSGKMICFPGDTLVWADDGLVKISEVMPGQKITAAGTLVKAKSLGEVESVQEHEGTFKCYDIALETGNSISVADSHFFLIESGQWAPLQNLKPGSKLISSKGVISIKNIIKRTSPFVGKVYNLKIKDSDYYVIGEDGIIVRDY